MTMDFGLFDVLGGYDKSLYPGLEGVSGFQDILDMSLESEHGLGLGECVVAETKNAVRTVRTMLITKGYQDYGLTGLSVNETKG